MGASPSTGVKALTDEGLPDAMAATDVVTDLANSPSFEPMAVLEFFMISSRNLLAAETAQVVILYTLVRATQFMEFIGSIAAARADGDQGEAVPRSLHAVSRNANSTEQARLPPGFVLDTAQTNLGRPCPASAVRARRVAIPGSGTLRHSKKQGFQAVQSGYSCSSQTRYTAKRLRPVN